MKKYFDKHSRGREAFLAAAVSILTLLPSVPVYGQSSASPDRLSPSARGYMERARTMLDAGNYGGVIDQLKMLNTRDTDFSILDALSPESREEYIYMLAEALYHRGDSECINLLRDFESTYPASPLALKARLAIADFYFFRHQWAEALEAYENVDFDRLNRSETPLYTYRKALTLIKTGNYNSARQMLRNISSVPEYRQAAKFYEAYLDYQEGELDKAYAGFSRIPESVDGLEPAYYIAQIDYSRGEYSKVIKTTAPLLRKKDINKELLPETALIRIVDPDFHTTTGVELGACNLVMIASTPVYIIILALASGSMEMLPAMLGLGGCVLVYLAALKLTGVWKKKTFSWK